MAANDIKRLKQELETIKKAKQQIQQTELAESIAAQVQRQEEATEENDSTKNGGGNFGKGLLYLGEELGLGLVRGIEGVGDFVVGGVADLFGGDAFAERVMKNDWLNYSHADEWFDPGEGWEFAGDVASGVGGMLPSVAAATAITLATGGAGAGAGATMLAQGVGTTLAQGVGITLFGLGAAGQATSEAVKETGALGGKEWLYGAGSGALETGIELASGGIGGSQVGKVFGKNLAKSAAGKVASTVIGEGLEEVASDVTNPLLRRVTGLDKSLAEAYKDVDAESLLRTFAVGGLTGAVMGGGSTAIGAIKSKGYNNYAAAQTAEQVSEWKADTNKRQAEGKKSIYKQKDIAKVSENLSKRLQKMDDTSRSAFLERNANIAYMFNADGTVTENAAVEAKKVKKERVQLPPEGTTENSAPTTENSAPTTDTNSGSYNPDAYSAGLKGYESKLEYKPVSSSSKISSEVKGVMNTLAKISRGKANIVLTEDPIMASGDKKANGLYKDGIIYLDANATDYQKALAVGVHEVVHTLEGTKDYDNLARHIADVISKDPALQEKYNQEKYRKAYDALLSGDYTETTKNYQASTEIFADYIANELAGNETSVKRLINKDRNIVVRMLDWVKNAIAKLGMSKEERTMRKGLEKLENLLSNALKSGTGGRPLEDVEKTARAAEKAHLEDEMKKKKAAQVEETQEQAVAQVEETQEAVAENATTAKEKPSTGRASLDVTGIDDFPNIDKWFESLTVEELRELIDNDSSINDISEELNVEPSKLRILMRREGLGKAYAVDGKDAVMKQSRIDEAIEDSGATNPTYARRYITRISTKDFIDLTVREDHMDREAFDKEVIGDHGSKMGEYDYEKALQTSRTPYLSIDKASGQVISHNGRHRIRALEKAGIESVEIEVDFFDDDGRLIKYDAETIPKMAISSQFDTDIETTISNVIPLNESHRSEIEKAYGEKAHPKAGVRYSLDVTEKSIQEAETDRKQRKTSSARFSLKYANEIAERQLKDNERFGFHVTDEKLNEAIESTARMVDRMSKHLDILPEDKIGKKNETIKSNSSYDKSIENTTICVRTLSYNQFVDKVQERLGRPLTQAESFLASQKLYEIAVDPQCLYCYVSLDRKAYNEFLLRYINERDEVIEEYKKSDKSKSAIEELYKKFLRGRKGEAPDSPMRKRFNMFIEMAEKGIKPLSAKDVSTKARQSEIANRGDYTSVQWKDMAAYAQSASWAKKQQDYVAYFNDILNLSKVAVDNLNKHYGLRFYSFSDYTAAFIVENMQQVTDAAIRGLKGLGYTKDVDFARIFAPTGMNINISMYAHKNAKTGEWEIDPRQSANLEDAIKLRDEYPNVGIVVTASTDEGVDWALKQKWSDVVIPFHIVRTGADVAEFYKWQNYTAESADTIADENLWNAYVNGRKKVSKNIYPAEHQNNKETYLKLIKERGLKPRFERFLDNPNYMKLVNETRQSAKDTKPMQPTFDVGAAGKSFDAFVGKGGYFKGWYKEGVNVDAEAETVAKDVAEGKKANEVDYGRQDIDTESLMKKRTAVRTHSRSSLDVELAKKTSDRVQTIVKDKGVIRQTISDIREGKKSVKETWDAIMEELKYGERARWIEIQIALTDQQAGIAKAAKNLDINVNGEIQRARAAKAAALNMLIYKQTDFAGNVVGESLREIFDPIQKKGAQYAQNFNEYLLHQLNIDRMSLEVDAKSKIKQLFKNNPQLQDAVSERYDSEEQWREGVKRTKGGKEYLSLLEMENKPVFQKEVTAEFSKERIAELDKQHPTFKDAAEKVWKYNKNLLQYRVDAGLITQAQADQMNKMYPHYVPAFYDTTNIARTGVSGGKNRVAVRTGIKSAKGSSGKADIIDVSVAISRQTESVVRAAAINKVVAKLYDKAVETKTFIDLDIAGQEKLTDPNVDYDEKIAKDNQVVFYKDGEKITLDVSEYMYAGFEGLGLYKRELNNPLESVTTKGVEIFKKLVTSWNPLFAATNTMKDLSAALFNTRYNVFKYMGRYVQSAFRFTSKKDSEYRKLWDAYRGIGGFQAGFYKGDLGAYDKRSGLRKGIARFTNALNNLNDYIEQIPRFAEFVASVKAGNSYEKALYDAADVTTNFSRGGSLVRKLNRSWIPFLNPAVQGWSKMYRTWVDPMDRLSEKEINKMAKSTKGRMLLSVYGELVLKTLVLGFGAGALNDLLFRWIDEDEDYEKLPLNVKENYYLIKSGDKFIKIPKGRETALLGMGSTRVIEYLNGNEEALDAWNWFTTAWGMVSPIDAASRHIASPVFDVLANRTWYGTEIESRTMEQMYEAKDRYDESTSSIAIAIGQALNWSPKKIHYFLDQYSGVLGDIILPMTTNKAEQGMIAARFVVDPLYTNNISNEYYNLKEELTYAKSAKDLSAMMVLKYLNKSDDKLSEIYQLKRDVANYEDLSIEEKKLLISKLKDAGLVDISNKATLTDVEKREITNLLQALLNGSLATLTENADTFEQIVLDEKFAEDFSKLIYSDMYIDFDEKKKNTAYNKAMGYYYELYMSKMLGVKLIPKYALYDAIGANETALYLTEISKIESDKDGNGDTITGSRKKKVHKYIQGLKLTVQQKNILMYLAGYTPTDAGKGAVNRYLLQNGYTRKEIDEIWN